MGGNAPRGIALAAALGLALWLLGLIMVRFVLWMVERF